VGRERRIHERGGRLERRDRRQEGVGVIALDQSEPRIAFEDRHDAQPGHREGVGDEQGPRGHAETATSGVDA